jgi:plastocyanin
MFKNKTVLIIGVIILIVVIVVLGMKYFKPTPSSSLVIPANTVVIQSNSFNPGTLTVKAGTKVTWTNGDSYTHNVTSNDGTFIGGNIDPTQSLSFTFTKAGTYNYHCAIHTFMTGTVVVTK